MAYKGKFSQLKNPQKYVGDPNNIVYRSHWERNVMRWLDENDNVVEWVSEEIAIPYDNPFKGRARYYPDFYFKAKDGTHKLIEIKPSKQTIQPKKPKSTTTKYISEMQTWAINCEKWKAAVEICKKNGIIFEIWTEETLKSIGILSWETDKRVLMAESTRKPKLKTHKLIKKSTRPRPKRRS